MVAKRRLALAAFVLPLALAACSGSDSNKDLDNLDNQLVDSANGADPAVTGALNDQIMVDPSLAGQRNGDAARPPSRPYSGGVPQGSGTTKLDTAKLMHTPKPVAAEKCSQCEAASKSLTVGELARRQKQGNLGGCAKSLNYSAGWANRLPKDVPLLPNARVTEAAGSTAGKCRLRVVSFWSDLPMQTVLDWYYTKVANSGFTAEHQVDGKEHILGGTRVSDDGAYVLFMTPRKGGGTSVDLVTNNGT
ncbi:hypothetical protein [Stakelama marina]|uniref:Lipoprotein n=1 Tax=Stakelama marina TaxID=2826939 RepID=A0A8T4ICH4_9SPHN|nr:hypothetical protein [Stakelama marina]MBR0552260.1 hypothetical protein [Stakelama marina]